jgi:hypothetical protein
MNYFQPFRTLGLVSGNVPLFVEHGKLDAYIFVVVDNFYMIYSLSRLRVLFIGLK